MRIWLARSAGEGRTGRAAAGGKAGTRGGAADGGREAGWRGLLRVRGRVRGLSSSPCAATFFLPPSVPSLWTGVGVGETKRERERERRRTRGRRESRRGRRLLSVTLSLAHSVGHFPSTPTRPESERALACTAVRS